MLNVHDIDKTLGNLFNGNGIRSIVNPNWKRPTVKSRPYHNNLMNHSH